MIHARPSLAGGLHWIRGELDQSLTRARALIEQYLDSPEDPGPLQQAAVELHQVRGTAAMIQCGGVATLAEEMKRTLQRLMQDGVEDSEATISALLGACVQLGDYIDALSSGVDDCVLAFAPVINELRVSRGAAVLSEAELLGSYLRSQSLTLALPPSPMRDERKTRAAAVKYLPAFQAALVAWYKGKDSDAALGRMGKIGELLAATATRPQTYLLWRVFTAMIESMLAGGVADALECKRLVGRVGQKIKRLAEAGEAALASDSDDLAYRMLFHVGRVAQPGPRAQSVLQELELERWLPSEARVAELRARIGGPNAALLTRLADEIRVDFAEVKDAIDLFVRAGTRSPADLGHVVDRLQRISNTLSMLGLSALQQVIGNQTQQIENLRQGGDKDDAGLWMDVATALLRVEHSLDGALFHQLHNPAGERALSPAREYEDRVPHSADHRDSVAAVFREALVDLAKLKSSVDAFLKSGQADGLSEAATLLARVQSAMTMLQHEVAAGLLGRIADFARSGSFERLAADPERAERFAMAVACVEYYLEACQHRQPDAEGMLEDLAGYVERLEAGLAVADAAPAEAADDGAAETEAVSETTAAVASEAPAAASPEVDPEIREIFLEEAAEVIEALQQQVPVLIRDPGNAAALRDVRRAFHTLKGSGRMVGATHIGEFGWALENLLNRCIDGSADVTQELVQLVADAVEALPELVADFRAGRAPGVRISNIVTRAEKAASGAGDGVESDVIDAFVVDAVQQVDRIRQWLEASPPLLVDAEAIRAFHTLRGSAAIVGEARIQELAAAAEQFLEAAASAGIALDDEARDLLVDAHETVRGWLAAVPFEPAADAGAARAAVKRLREQLARLPAEARDVAASRDLLGVFAHEALDLLQSAEQAARQWAAQPASDAARARVLRDFQGLQAGASTAACEPLRRIAASFVEALRDPHWRAPSTEYFAALGELLERTHQVLDAYQLGVPGPDVDAVCADIADLHAGATAAETPRAAPDGEPAPVIAAGEAESAGADDGDGAPDPELLEIFQAEAEELLEELDRQFDAWEREPTSTEPLAEINRALHTLKGSARMAGQYGIGEVGHAMESMLSAVERGERQADKALFSQAHHVVDGLYRAVDALKQGQAPDVSALLAELAEDAAEAGQAEPSPGATAGVAADGAPVEPESAAGAEAGADAAAGELNVEDSRVSLDGLEADAVAAVTGASGADAAPLPADDRAAPSDLEAGDRTEPAEIEAAEALDDGSPPARVEGLEAREADEDGDGSAFDAELAEIFSSEAGELLEQLGAALARWSAEPADIAAMNEMQRALHTLKGGARMAGLLRMGTCAHDMETRVNRIEAGIEIADDDAFAALAQDLEQLAAMHDQLLRGEARQLARAEAEPEEMPMPVEAIEPAGGDAPPGEDAGPPSAAAADAGAGDAGLPDAAAGPWGGDLLWKPESSAAIYGSLRRETARVPVETLDRLLNQAGEISIFRSRLEQYSTGLKFQLKEMQQTIDRVRDQLRQMELETEAQIEARGLRAGDADPDRYEGEFDPLEMDRYSRMQELSRALSESINDLTSLHASMDEVQGESESLLQQQGRVNTEVQQGLMRALMVPFSRQVQRLQRVVRQVADETGKRARVEFSGVDAELDRNVLERMTAPLEHLLRNAVAHGIETPEQRRQAGKAETGRIDVSLTREGPQLVIELRDDGRGLDIDAIRRKAVERGLMPADAEVDERSVAQFIFEPGFSTAREVTQVAGRGVGMDVVAAEVKQLGGTLELDSERGRGTRFVIRLPLTLAISQALLVSVGGEQFAIPLSSINGIGRIPVSDLPGYFGDAQRRFEYGGQAHEVRYLGDFVDIPRPEAFETRTVPAVMLRIGEGLGAGSRRVAVVVDATLGNREIVSKAVGPQVSSVLGISGATILADGSVVLILDVPALVQDEKRRALMAEAAGGRSTALADDRELIMVVDDSITMRRVAERLLTRNGYRVLTAKDGLDAIAQLHAESPRAILLDIEMPRADGFEVATFVRNNERIADVPIIMITSRSGDKHRQRAAEIGVNRYLIKPYQEEQLLNEVRSVTATETAA